jgi:hypothetical protein
MTFVTHTVGGGWSGGGTQVANCSTAEMAAIRAAFTDVQNRGRNCASALGIGALDSCLASRGNEATIALDCRGAGCGGVFGFSHVNGNDITFCDDALPPNGLQQDTDVTMFHELVHCCGGVEVDAWSLENHCYARHGTITPSSAVVAGFRGETSDVGGGLRAGTFVVWEPATGKVFVKVTSGGSWNSAATVGRGAQLNVNQAAYTSP